MSREIPREFSRFGMLGLESSRASSPELKGDQYPPIILDVEGEVIQIRGKTDQRVEEVLRILQESTGPLCYDDFRLRTGGSRQEDGVVTGGVAYDLLLFVLTTLVCLGLAERSEEIEGPGRPRVFYRWIGKARLPRAFSRV